MMSTNKTAVVLIVLGLVLLAAVAYLFLVKPEGSAVSVSETTITDTELTFLSLTAQIEKIEFTTNILTDPRFIGLQDLRTAIVPELSGRSDPFAPLTGISTK